MTTYGATAVSVASAGITTPAIVPIACVVVSWFAMHLGFVRPPYIEVVWTLPAPAGAWLSTGGDPKAVALQLINLLLALLIWWPFVRRYDRSLCTSEHCK